MWVRCLVVKATFHATKPTSLHYPTELNTLGDHLRKVRLDRGLSQPQVAEVLNVKTDTVTLWELNRNTPTAKLAKRIIEYIGYIPDAWTKAPVSEQLYYTRQVQGITYRQLAKELGLDASTIREFENETRTSSQKTLSKILDYIKCNLILD